MLDRLAHVGVALHTQPRQEPDAVLIWLAKRMRCAAAYRNDYPAYQLALPS